MLQVRKKSKFYIIFFQKVDNCVGCSNTKALFMPIISCSLNNHSKSYWFILPITEILD